jgi:uncharacterized membrane protein
MVLVHIFAGLLAITAGFVALFAAKGGRMHRRTGIAFVYSMVVMTVAGGIMAAMQFHLLFQRLNVMAATLTCYLVVTSLLTVRLTPSQLRRVAAGTAVIALAAALFSIGAGLEAMTRPRASWFPTVPALIFGSVALLAAIGDLRIALGRELDGPHRVARHLWRMCFGMFIATGSFFLGQAKVFPEALRIAPLLAAPVLLVLGTMFYWWGRVLITKRVPRRPAERDRATAGRREAAARDRPTAAPARAPTRAAG